MKEIIINRLVRFPWSDKKISEIVSRASKKERKIEGELEINVVGDSVIKYLNRLYRNRNTATDVLSFAWQEEKKIKSAMLGQIYICYPQIKRQAREWKVSNAEEFTRMLVHGLLHLAGYDHMDKKGQEQMFVLQEELVSKCKELLE